MALFPPIVASSMPAFAIEENSDNNTVKIYYTLSTYNSSQKEGISQVHVSVRRQSSNVNVLAGDYEILEKEAFVQDEEDKILNRYYITLNSSQIKEGFKKDVLYKVQLRFSSISYQQAKNRDNSISLVSFFTNNVQYFSEWSQVCIIKPIIAPIFYIDDFHYTSDDDYGQKESAQDTFTNSLADFIGVYKANKSSENLKYWRLRLLNQNFTKEDKINIDNYTLIDSGWKNASAFNYTLDSASMVFECCLMYDFSKDSIQSNIYKLYFEIQTKNGYTDSKIYTFEYQQVSIDAIPGKILSYVNNEEGYIKFVFQTTASRNGNIAIRRADSKHNFLNWQDLTNFLLFDKLSNGQLTYYDFTVQSGTAYKYLIQRRDPRGRRGTPTTSQIIIPEWQHAFLLETAGNGDINKVKQLKLKYDFQISSYKTNISENKTDTIGSQYPFIRRNGNMYYRSFPITGTITAYMDNIELFTNKSILYGEEVTGLFTEDYRGKDYIFNTNKQYDYIQERKFREQVEKFLYNAKPKLYKSTQEGNIFIKIMDVSLTPKTELDRLIYTFSGTAYEIEDFSLQTLNKYNFIEIGTFDPQPAWGEEKIGQLTSFKSEDQPIGNIFLAGKDIIGTGQNAAENSIANKHRYKKIFNGRILDDFYLEHLKFTIESEPYLIIEDPKGHFRVFDDIDNDGKDFIDYTSPINYPLYQIESTYNENNVYLGTLFEINGQQIIVSYPNNIYELKDDNLRLASNTTIIPAKDTIMTIDYKIKESYKEDVTSVPKRITIQDKIGQISGKYNFNSRLINQIKNKYTFTFYKENEKTADEELVKQYIDSILSISIDTQPGTVVNITMQDRTKDSSDLPTRLVINETGQLLFDPQNDQHHIINFSIVGKTYKKERDLRSRGDKEILFSERKRIKEFLNQVENPVHKDLYHIFYYQNSIKTDKYYVFYKSNWYEAEFVKSPLNFQEDQNWDYIDVKCPVDAILFYKIRLRRDYF